MTETYAPLRYVTPSGILTVGDPRYVAPEGSTGTSVGIVVDADYTGATDAAPAINAALDQARQTAGAWAAQWMPPVILKAGLLRLDSPILSQPRMRLVGAGMRATRLIPYGNVTAIAGQTYGDPDDVTIQDLEIDGSHQTAGAPAEPKGIFFVSARRLTIANVYVHDTWATGIGVDYITGTITNVHAVGCGRQNAARTAVYPGCSGIGIGVGNLADDWEPLLISGCHTSGNGNYGIFLETQNNTRAPEGITISGNTARNNYRSGIGICGSVGARVIGNTCVDNLEAGVGVDTGTMGVAGGGKPGEHALVMGNHLAGNQWGVRVLGEGSLSVVSPHIVSNTIRANTGAGVLLRSTSSGSVSAPWIDGNAISGNGGQGVLVDGSTTVARLAITRNRIHDNTGAAVTVSATTTDPTYTDNEAWANAGGDAMPS